MDLLFKELRYKIIGCAMEVHNTIGHGFRERTYENALKVEFKEKNISFSSQEEFQVLYKGKVVDNFIPDLIIEDKVILELKVVDIVNDDHIGQIMNYLKITGLQIGIIINFKHPELEWKPIILT